MIVALLLGVVGLVVLNVTAPRTPRRSTTPSTTTSAAHLPTTTTTIPDPGPYGVGLATYTLDEPGKTLCAPHGVASGCVVRSMPLYVMYPTTGAAEQQSTSKPYYAGGPYPLVVFGNGYLEPVSSYSVLLDYWVSRGYVVAAPQFPLSQGSSIGGPWESDILNQPGDLQAAISFVLARDQSSGSLLYGLVDGSAVAVAGQSDGADAALALAYNTCCSMPGIQAVISLSGAELQSYPGKYFTVPGPPLFVSQGTDDDVNVPSDSEALYAAASGPKYYLSLFGANHLEAYQQVNSYSQVVETTTTSFLNYYLKHNSASLGHMVSSGNVEGVSTLH